MPPRPDPHATLRQALLPVAYDHPWSALLALPYGERTVGAVMAEALAAGARPDAVMEDGPSLLTGLASAGCMAGVRALLPHVGPTDPRVPTESLGQVLMAALGGWAPRHRRERLALTLIRVGADPYAFSRLAHRDGRSTVVYHDFWRVMWAWTQRGTDWDRFDDSGQSPLGHTAAFLKAPVLMPPAGPTAPGGSGLHPLLVHAVNTGPLRQGAYLVAMGADPRQPLRSWGSSTLDASTRVRRPTAPDPPSTWLEAVADHPQWPVVLAEAQAWVTAQRLQRAFRDARAERGAVALGGRSTPPRRDRL